MPLSGVHLCWCTILYLANTWQSTIVAAHPGHFRLGKPDSLRGVEGKESETERGREEKNVG